jgi:hypothetical protein
LKRASLFVGREASALDAGRSSGEGVGLHESVMTGANSCAPDANATASSPNLPTRYSQPRFYSGTPPVFLISVMRLATYN